jgi:glutathione-specific gamma-glutamylcyclotransferase
VSDADLWVFGYGSLMWRPGFHYEEAVHATLHGAHRALCIYSHVHRGTPRHPGLVLGLDNGGTCEGVGFRVAARNRHAVLAYLRRREQVSNVYRPVLRWVSLKLPEAQTAKALCYMVNRNHRQYAGDLPVIEQVRLVRRSKGRSGKNTDYVVNTVRHLRECGVVDTRLERLMPMLGGVALRSSRLFSLAAPMPTSKES